MKLELINETLITEANWYKKKKYENVIDLLKDFAEDHIKEVDLWFISFTSIDKLGINPNSSYRTPIGIYAYQLTYAIEHEFLTDLPFVGDAPFINLFKIKNDAMVLNTVDFDEIANHYVEKFKNKYQVNPDIAGYDLRSNISELWLKTREFVNKDPHKWGHILRSIGVEGFIDYGTSTIHPSEPTQSVFFSADVIDKTIRLLNRDFKREKGEKGKVKKDEIKYETTSNITLALKKLNNFIGVSIRNADKDSIHNLFKNVADGKHKTILRSDSIPRLIVRSMVKYNKYELVEHILDTFDKFKKEIGAPHVFGHIRGMISAAYEKGSYQIIDRIMDATSGNIYQHVSIDRMIHDYELLDDRYKIFEMFERYINDPKYMRAYIGDTHIKRFNDLLDLRNNKKYRDNPLITMLEKYLIKNDLYQSIETK